MTIEQNGLFGRKTKSLGRDNDVSYFELTFGNKVIKTIILVNGHTSVILPVENTF